MRSRLVLSGFAFIEFPSPKTLSAGPGETTLPVAGFCTATFEGSNKSGAARSGLLGSIVHPGFRLPPEAGAIIMVFKNGGQENVDVRTR